MQIAGLDKFLPDVLISQYYQNVDYSHCLQHYAKYRPSQKYAFQWSKLATV